MNKKYEIVNIRCGHGPGRNHIIYAELREVGTHSLVISATLDYIVARLPELLSEEK